ncbi:hypothetical protein PybrP1_011600 [[Pythium] brassicae (nom. inval.)]|nr:hypothetical protein PybrP1_011600 [[Pythium] brassicae (nom. inval.)]
MLEGFTSPYSTALAQPYRDELTLEAALAFVDGCSLESDRDDSVDTNDEPLTVAAPAAGRQVHQSCSASGDVRRKAPLSPGFITLVDKFERDSNSDSDDDVSIEETLRLVDAGGGQTGAVGGGDEATKPKKKRIRRQREELLYLRVKVAEMQQMLDDLHNGCYSSESGGSGLEGSEENKQLKATLGGQKQLTSRLERLLIGQDDPEVSNAPPLQMRCTTPFGVDDYDATVLQEHKRGVEHAYLRFEHELAASSPCEAAAETGMDAEFTASKIVPLGV